MRHISDDQRRRRLVQRHHLGQTAASVEAAIHDVVAMHSSDPATPYVALKARVPDITVHDVEEALYARRGVWRIHAMRRTLWIIAVADSAAVRGAATHAVADRERRRLEGWITAMPGARDAGTWIRALEAQVNEELADGEPHATSDLTVALPELGTRIQLGSGKWSSESPISSRLLFLMAMDGGIVRTRPLGSWRASQYRWVTAASWFDGPCDAPLAPPVARAQLASRWLGRFGPATSADIQWWMGWTKKQTTEALQTCLAVPVQTADGPAWLAVDDSADDSATGDLADAGVVTLLPALDPTPMGWKSREWYLGGHGTFGGPLFDRNGNVGPTVWSGGQVIGGWAQRPDGEVVTHLLADVGTDIVAAVDVQAETMSEWLAPDVITPRFRTPLEKTLSTG